MGRKQEWRCNRWWACFADVQNEPVDAYALLVVRAVRADDLPKLEWSGTMSHWRNDAPYVHMTTPAGQRFHRLWLRYRRSGWTGRDRCDAARLLVRPSVSEKGAVSIGTALLRTGDMAREHGFRQLTGGQ